MIFMVLEAKDVPGSVPRLNEDLLDIQGIILTRVLWLKRDDLFHLCFSCLLWLGHERSIS